MTLANSDGCSWNGPMTNQARAPLRARARTVTASSSAVVDRVEEQRPLPQAPVVDDRGEHHHAERADP